MEMSFLSLWNEMIANPILFMTVVLTLGVIFVNGWTDAPNAIAVSYTHLGALAAGINIAS